MENKFNVKVGDVVKVDSSRSFDPAIGMVDAIGEDWIAVKITSAKNDNYKRHYDDIWGYRLSQIVEVISGAGESKAKPKSSNRVVNFYDVYFVANTNAPSGKEITFDFYPTDEELYDILSLTIQDLLYVNERIANILLEYSTLALWAKMLTSYVDDAIDKVIGGQDLYEIYYEQEHGH